MNCSNSLHLYFSEKRAGQTDSFNENGSYNTHIYRVSGTRIQFISGAVTAKPICPLKHKVSRLAQKWDQNVTSGASPEYRLACSDRGEIIQNHISTKYMRTGTGVDQFILGLLINSF